MDILIIGMTAIILAYIFYISYRMLSFQSDFMNSFSLPMTPFTMNGKLLEGLENKETGGSGTTNGSLGMAKGDGFASNSESYAAQLKIMASRLKDKVSVANYRSHLEDVVYSMDEYVGMKMLEIVCSAASSDSSTFVTNMDSLNKLNDAKTSLATCMKIIDSTS